MLFVAGPGVPTEEMNIFDYTLAGTGLVASWGVTTSSSRLTQIHHANGYGRFVNSPIGYQFMHLGEKEIAQYISAPGPAGSFYLKSEYSEDKWLVYIDNTNTPFLLQKKGEFCDRSTETAFNWKCYTCFPAS